MPGHGLLEELVLTYLIALALMLIGARFGVPSIVAFMLGGVVAGPAGLGIVADQTRVELLAEVGVVLLLFMVGLEFSFRDLGRLWRTLVVGGTLQVAITSVVAGLLAVVAWRVGWALAALVGLFVALSSTAIVLKELAARNELSSPHGQLTAGVLLFQDLATVVVLAVEPVLAGTMPLRSAPLVLGKTLFALAVVLGAGRVFLPRLLRVAALARSREAFTLATLIVSIGTAWLASLLGASMAIGAFLAGLVLAESEFSHQIHAELRPQRDVLASLFFISIGMLIDPVALAGRAGEVLGAAGALVVVKAASAWAAFALVSVPLRVALVSALGVAQVGEFSFLLGRAGVKSGLIPGGLWQVLLASGVLTMAVAPVVLARAPAAAAWVASRLGRRREKAPMDEPGGPSGHVVIVGFGVGGRLVAQALRGIGQPYVVFELNAATVQEARLAGEPAYYGDASLLEAIPQANLARARALVVMVSDPDASVRMVRAARRQAPALPIVVRARYKGEVDQLERAGATLAVAEELEASLEVLAQLLVRLDLPGNIVDVLLDGLRAQTPGNRPLRAPQVPLAGLGHDIGHLPIATYQVGANEWAVGRSLAEVNLRAETGASVLAIRRGGSWLAPPPVAMALEAGDVLYLLGEASDVALARARLGSGGGA